MIEESQYRLPGSEQSKPKPKPKEDTETLAYLESLPWRPIGVEW